MTCPLARQFARWAREAVQPAADQWFGTRIMRIETFGTYGCRTRQQPARRAASEHAFANAVDVSGFVLEGGRRITVQDGWNGEDERVRRSCAPSTRPAAAASISASRPDSDAYHYNHMHFDMGRGPYCR